MGNSYLAAEISELRFRPNSSMIWYELNLPLNFTTMSKVLRVKSLRKLPHFIDTLVEIKFFFQDNYNKNNYRLIGLDSGKINLRINSFSCFFI